MTLPASGQIDMGQVNVELGLSATATISLNDTAVRTLAGILSSAITLNDLHGKSNIPPIPSGLIIMSADGSTPSGWTRFSAADGYYIAGAGNSYSVGAAARSLTNNVGVSSSSGNHAGSNHSSRYYTTGGVNHNGGGSGGNHSHNIIGDYTPPKQQTVLIKANSNLTVLPANGMGFGVSTLSGFSVFSASNFLNGYSSVGAAAELFSISCAYDGAHIHGARTGGGAESSWGTCGVGNSSHIHDLFSPTATASIKRAILRGLYKASAYAPVAGLIGMWEGTTAPTGWTLCNGANGTVDLRDYFILFSATGDGTRTGDNTVVFTVSIGSSSWTHQHYDTYTGEDYSGNYVMDYSASHSHTVSTITASFIPARYALTFIQYTG